VLELRRANVVAVAVVAVRLLEAARNRAAAQRIFVAAVFARVGPKPRPRCYAPSPPCGTDRCCTGIFLAKGLRRPTLRVSGSDKEGRDGKCEKLVCWENHHAAVCSEGVLLFKVLRVEFAFKSFVLTWNLTAHITSATVGVML